MLGVRIGGALHALPIDAVVEVLPALPVETIPQCPSFVRGVVFVRGHLIPVFDAAERLDLAEHSRPVEPHIVCLRVDGRLVGLEVDEAIELFSLPAAGRLPVDSIGAGAGMLSQIVEHEGQIVRVLNPQRMVSAGESAALDQIPRVRSQPSR